MRLVGETVIHFMCSMGCLEEVRDTIALAKKDVSSGKPNTVTNLLESRLSPLLLRAADSGGFRCCYRQEETDALRRSSPGSDPRRSSG